MPRTKSKSRTNLVSGNREAEQNLFYRNGMEITPSTLDKQSRRVRAVLTTEDPVLVYDWRLGEVVEEVLLVDGAKFETQTPLLRDHSQWSVRSILGSVFEVGFVRDELNGLLEFGKDLDEEAESIWRRVEQGHLRRGSIGYDYTQADYEVIPAGETRTINGRAFTANKARSMRVVRSWRLREYSMVVIPADARATLKSQGSQGTEENTSQNSQLETPSAPAVGQNRSEETMKKFLQFLHKAGLSSKVTNEAEALTWARSGNLSAEQIDEFAAICESDDVKFIASEATAKKSATTGTRSNSGSTENEVPNISSENSNRTGGATQPVTDAALQAAREAIAAERKRVAEIQELHRQHSEVVPASLAEQAIAEGWNLDRARGEFLNAMVDGRASGAPSIHIRGSNQINRRVLQAALLEREGIRPEDTLWQSNQVRTLAGRRRELDIAWATTAAATGHRDEIEQAYDIASQQGLRGASLMRIAELCVEQSAPGRRLYNEDEIMERAFTSGDFSAVFGAVVHMQLLSSYSRAPSPYRDFCEVREVGDFRTHSTADMGQVSRLKKMGKNGGTAALLNTEDQTLTSLLIERFAGQLVIDDQTLINDAFGVADMLPAEIGEMCGGMVDDMAMSEVLATGNLSDSLARYNSTTGNVVSVSAVTESALTSVNSKLKAQRVGKRRIDVRNSVILAGTLHAPTLRRWSTSEFVADNMRNPHQNMFRVLEDTAVDLGVYDPRSDDTLVAGTPTMAYAFSTGTKRSIVVAFRRGTGQGPVTRPPVSLDSNTTDRWGLAWKVYMDMGAAFQRRIGTVRLTITG